MLFDLGKDISETNDIIGKNEDLAKLMEEELRVIIDASTSKNLSE